MRSAPRRTGSVSQECAAAVEKIKHRFHTVESLRDVSVEQFETVVKLLPPVIARRARHVVTENDRVNQFLEASALAATCDAHGRAARRVPPQPAARLRGELRGTRLPGGSRDRNRGVYGARMTGGGFGGCTVNMLRNRRALARFQGSDRRAVRSWSSCRRRRCTTAVLRPARAKSRTSIRSYSSAAAGDRSITYAVTFETPRELLAARKRRSGSEHWHVERGAERFGRLSRRPSSSSRWPRTARYR